MTPPPSPASGPAQISALASWRPLTPGDLAAGASAPPPTTPTAARPLRELRPSHHQLARMLAKGIRPVEISLITGFSQSRISILKNDPAFAELLAHYREVEDTLTEELSEKVKLMAADALAELHARLVDAPESFGNSALLDVVMSALDRSGVGPKSEVKHSHLHVTPTELAQLRTLATEQGRVLKGANHACPLPGSHPEPALLEHPQPPSPGAPTGAGSTPGGACGEGTFSLEQAQERAQAQLPA